MSPRAKILRRGRGIEPLGSLKAGADAYISIRFEMMESFEAKEEEQDELRYCDQFLI